MERCGISLNNQVVLDLSTLDFISREVYEQEVLEPTQEALVEKGLADQIQRLVPTYGILLRVEAVKATANDKSSLVQAQRLVTERCRNLIEKSTIPYFPEPKNLPFLFCQTRSL